MHKNAIFGDASGITSPDTAQTVTMVGGSSPLTNEIPASGIVAGEMGALIGQGKKTFSDTSAGYLMGLDSDGTYKWIIGSSSSSADWNVTTANTFTVNGTIVATSGTIGGWVLTSNTLYSLTSGTPTAVPNNGIVMQSGATNVISVYEGTTKRTEMGYLSAGVYGLKGYATNGTTIIFEISDTQQRMAGFYFTDTILRSNTTDATSSIFLDSANSLIRAGVTAGNYITIDGANLRIRSSNYVANVSGFTVEPTLIEAENLVARGIMKGSTFQYDLISAVGGQVMVANSDVLASDMTALDASTLTTRGTTTWAVNDMLVIRSITALGIQEEYLRVTAVGSAPTYSVTRDLAGTFTANTNPIWQQGTTIVKQGVSDGAAAFSGGYLRLFGEGTNAPYYSVYQRTGVAYNAVTERVRMGNLNGFLDYASDIFGIAMGSSAANQANITIDPTNGLRVRNATTSVFTVDNSGNSTLLNLTVGGSLNVSTSGNVRSGQTAYNTGTGWFMEYNAATPRLSLGNPATNYMTWDGTNLTLNGVIITGNGGSSNNSVTTGEAIDGSTTPQIVCVDQADNLMYRADGNATARVQAYGFVTTNASITTAPNVVVSGEVSGFTGLTVGATYYVSDTAGAISTTPSTTTTIPIGTAISATKILLKFGKKCVSRSISITGGTAATGNTDTTFTLGFRPEKIKLRFSVLVNMNGVGRRQYSGVDIEVIDDNTINYTLMYWETANVTVTTSNASTRWVSGAGASYVFDTDQSGADYSTHTFSILSRAVNNFVVRDASTLVAGTGSTSTYSNVYMTIIGE